MLDVLDFRSLILESFQGDHDLDIDGAGGLGTYLQHRASQCHNRILALVELQEAVTAYVVAWDPSSSRSALEVLYYLDMIQICSPIAGLNVLFTFLDVWSPKVLVTLDYHGYLSGEDLYEKAILALDAYCPSPPGGPEPLLKLLIRLYKTEERRYSEAALTILERYWFKKSPEDDLILGMIPSTSIKLYADSVTNDLRTLGETE